MDQKQPSHSSVYANIFDDLRVRISDHYEMIGMLEQRVLSLCWNALGSDYRPITEEIELARRYFYFCTVPLLDAAGLLRSNNLEQAVFWGAIQLALGLHLRYIDYVIDNDIEDTHHLASLKRSQLYLAHAQDLLSSCSLPWSPAARALYVQFFDYETDVKRGYLHDFGTIWRRVSPLCIVGECYLQQSMRDRQALWYYRNFLGWSLLQADCDDAMKDLIANRETPVIRLVQEQYSATFHFGQVFGSVIANIKDQLAAQTAYLYASVAELYPIWGIILSGLDDVFTHFD